MPFIWDQTCQNAFESIKQYLTKPPSLMALVQGRPLILYTAARKQSLGLCWLNVMIKGKKIPCTISAGQWWVQKQITLLWKKFFLS